MKLKLYTTTQAAKLTGASPFQVWNLIEKKMVIAYDKEGNRKEPSEFGSRQWRYVSESGLQHIHNLFASGAVKTYRRRNRKLGERKFGKPVISVDLSDEKPHKEYLPMVEDLQPKPKRKYTKSKKTEPETTDWGEAFEKSRKMEAERKRNEEITRATKRGRIFALSLFSYTVSVNLNRE